MLDDVRCKRHVLEECVWSDPHQRLCTDEQVLLQLSFVHKRKCVGKDTPAISEEWDRRGGREQKVTLPRLYVTPVPAAASSWSSVCARATTFLLPLVQSSFLHRMRPKPLILPFSPARSWSRQHLYSPSHVLRVAGCYS